MGLYKIDRYGVKVIKAKKSVALVDYIVCSPNKCNPDEAICAAVEACSKAVLEQIDGPFEAPIVDQDMCLGCGDCVEACPLEAIRIKHNF
jgi:Fe-S-cluster-containing hydrogenase component 2